MRTVSWPDRGDATTYRRRLGVALLATLMAAGGLAAVALAARPGLEAAVLPLAVAVALLGAVCARSAATGAARRTEIIRSFAGLRVLHAGEAYIVDDAAPLIGEYPNRRQAAAAAHERGSWAIVIRAWDRCYLLAARPARSTSSPVSFRSRAVADVVPALVDGVA